MSKNTNWLIPIMGVFIFSTSCQKSDPQMQAAPFATNLVGKWQWVKTSTSTGEINPQTLGHGKSLSYGNDGLHNYLYLREEGQPAQVLYQDNSVGESDQAKGLLVGQFSGGYVQFFLEKAADNTYQAMTTTDLVSIPSKGYGSTRHYYQRVGVPDKP